MMKLPDQWQHGFAVQALADLQTRDVLCRPVNDRVPNCHRLLFLQMACEKLVKAHLFSLGYTSEGTLRTHAVISKYLPIIINSYHRRQKGKNLSRSVYQRIRIIARDIELLAPAVNAGGLQPANCEYPWLNASGTRVLIPAEHEFTSLDLAREPAGRIILKLLPVAIAALMLDARGHKA